LASHLRGEMSESSDPPVVQVPTVDLLATPPESPKKKKRKRGIRNPGSFADIPKDSKDVLNIDTFVGACFRVNKAPIGLPFAQLGSINAGYDETSAERKFLDVAVETVTPVGTIFTKIDDHFNLFGRYSHRFTKNLSVKASVSKRSSVAGILDIEQKWKTGTSTLTASQSSRGEPLHVAASLCQAMTQRIAVAAEVSTEWNKETHVACAARYKVARKKPFQNWVATIQANDSRMGKATYTQKFLPGFALATSLLIGQDMASVANIGYRYDMSTFKFQGSISSTGQVSALLQNVMNPEANMVLLVSGSLNHFTKKAGFGIGFRAGD